MAADKFTFHDQKRWVYFVSEFIDFIRELLGKWGAVSARRMFGGHGLYFDGVMFAIVMNNRLFLKVDTHNRADFENLGLKPPFLHDEGQRGRLVVLGCTRRHF